jgi:FixJ family two-component response regulator
MDLPSVVVAPALLPYLIAVVDDDRSVRDALKFALELEGYTVETFDSAESLLAEAFPQRMDCLVIDQRLPGLNGLDLLGALRKRAVDAPAILMTSHPDANLRRNAAAARAPIVEKPLISQALTSAINQALQSRPARDPE